MKPGLDDATGAEKLWDHTRRIDSRAVRDRDAVAPFDRRDRVELDARRAPDCGLHVVGAGAADPRPVGLRRHGEPTKRRERDRLHGGQIVLNCSNGWRQLSQ